MSNTKKRENHRGTCSCFNICKLFNLSSLQNKRAAAAKHLSNPSGMGLLPEPIVQCILSNINDAKDVAVCKSVSKTWNDLMPYITTLYFPRHLFAKRNPDYAILQMITSIVRLEQLIIECPFSVAGIFLWLSISEPSLRFLDLRFHKDDLGTRHSSKLNCIGLASNLESLKLSCIIITEYLTWDVFHKLTNLEIVDAAMANDALLRALRACPHLTSLSLLACNGVSRVTIEMPCLKHCKLDFYGEDLSLSVSAPNLEDLELQGFNRIQVSDANFLRNLSIGHDSGVVWTVVFGKLEALERLSISGERWKPEAMREILLVASKAKEAFICKCGFHSALFELRVDSRDGFSRILQFSYKAANS